MECKPSSVLGFQTTIEVLPFIRAYIGVVTLFNLTGNSVLLWALRKTGQTKTISFRFIITMSISDLILNTANLINMLVTIAFEEDTKICWITLFCHFLISTCNTFSFIMVALIALDRYLHMRYLQRYPSIVTKRRGFLLGIIACIWSSIINVACNLPLQYNVPHIIQAIYLLSLFPVALSIFILYYCAMKTIRSKASQLTRDIITHTRALSRAAVRITICVIILTVPVVTIQFLELVHKHRRFTSPSLLGNIKMFIYITYSTIAFWSSYIFMSHNRPIRKLLRQCLSICKRAAINSTDRATQYCN